MHRAENWVDWRERVRSKEKTLISLCTATTFEYTISTFGCLVRCLRAGCPSGSVIGCDCKLGEIPSTQERVGITIVENAGAYVMVIQDSRAPAKFDKIAGFFMSRAWKESRSRDVQVGSRWVIYSPSETL